MITAMGPMLGDGPDLFLSLSDGNVRSRRRTDAEKEALLPCYRQLLDERLVIGDGETPGGVGLFMASSGYTRAGAVLGSLGMKSICVGAVHCRRRRGRERGSSHVGPNRY